MTISIPELSLVALIGVSGSGKSAFARRHFKPTEILSSDFFRGLVSDDETSQAATADAFDALYFVARKRLAAGLLTVVDATNVQPAARKPLLALAREFHAVPVAIALDAPESLAIERNENRTDRNFGPHVVRQQARQFRESLRKLEREGFRHVHVLQVPGDLGHLVIERRPLWCNKKDERGPFDIIGDIHGCFDELAELLRLLGHAVDETSCSVTVSSGRRLIFLGDLVDRGPKTPQVLRLVMSAVAAGAALCVPGNHDIKLMRKLRGRDVTVAHGLAESLAQLEAEPEEFRKAAADFIDGLVSHYVLDSGRLVVAHAGMKQSLQGRASGAVRDFALFGETTGETDEFGLPVRHNWAAEYRGSAMVVYGHTPVPEPEWLNKTINIDTGCVFGGRLTALRYPEREIVSVPARRVYAAPARPLAGSGSPMLTAQQQADTLLDVADLLGKRIVETEMIGRVTIREENAAAALEIMSRFAVDPRWLIYLPPAMAPCGTSKLPDLLEHPAEAFAYYREAAVPRVVLEEKHMGSRAVVIVCKDADTALRRFGIPDGPAGIIYTRTGRRFFFDSALERALLDAVREAATAAGLWEELETGWLCLDCEIMPWSAKAGDLLRAQYAPVGVAAQAALSAEAEIIGKAAALGQDVTALAQSTLTRLDAARRFSGAWKRYCWPVTSAADLRVAPFHLLASEGRVHTDKPHDWHMRTLARLAGGMIIATPWREASLTRPESEAEAVAWWEELTARGGEGVVIKPLKFVVRSGRLIVQPAVKCRGREYLRIIYGPEYDLPENLERLRERNLSAKRFLAIREFALGIEALNRFIRREPLRRVHEAVFAILALESEPVDPRL